MIAVEPSPVMIAQRRPGSAPALGGVAEDLPLEDKSVDAAMGVLTIHHWRDLDAGLAEMRRVARRRIVLLTIDTERNAEVWTLSECFPEAMALERDLLRGSSLWHKLPSEAIERRQRRLRADLESGRWDERHGHLRAQPELDIGLRLICEEL